MADNDKCDLCDTELHSITTRRVMDAKLCPGCSGYVSPIMIGSTKNLVEMIKATAWSRAETIPDMLQKYFGIDKFDRITVEFVWKDRPREA